MVETTPRVRQRFGDHDGTGSQMNADDDELKPLSISPHDSLGRLSANSPKRTVFSPAIQDKITCLGDVWKMFASTILTIILILPFLYSCYKYLNDPPFEVPNYPSDRLTCARDYNISFAELHQKIHMARTFCEEGVTDCPCTDPLRPLARVLSSPQYFSKWDSTHARNRKLAKQVASLSPQVVFYGDSIIEHMLGTDLGARTQDTVSVKKQFDNVFGDLAIPLGLAGDRCPQLLYRLKRGELPNVLDPPVIWILIGTNDQADRCSDEAILMGIIGISQYLNAQRPYARIVINSILPKPHPITREWEGTQYYNSVNWINQRLECYVQSLEDVEYFDATSIFQNDQGLIPLELIPDGIHPSGKGTRLWSEAILRRLEQILDGD